MTRVVTLVAIAATLAACAGDSPSISSDEAAPIVERLTASPTPQRWNFSYQPDSASPYVACLNGLDEVSGSIDVNVGMLRLAPERDAPALIVTGTSLLIAEPNQPNSWLEIPLGPSGDESRLVGLFGEALAGYIVTGVKAPDLKTTVLAAIDIATSVDTTPAPFGLPGDAIEITINPDRYLDELAAGGVTVTDEDRNRIPTITAVVDPLGRVTGLVVDPPAAGDDAAVVEHRDRYVITATYDQLEPLELPDDSSRTRIDLDIAGYPRPDASCTLGS
ncbi:MAG: hypothetical protein ACE37B_06575 [Ilumatobacter sp.]|uniref:hypothetical protein n=1 Tax=Ilumatobacter sp. TaxID=1967498 RepID=UPI00391CA7BB